jgi:hypothetical protein
MADNCRAVVGRLLDTLVAARDPEGGWGYFAGKAVRLEPTSWATLALLEARARLPDGGLNADLAVLAGWQQPTGLLADTPPASPNLAFNGFAAVVLRRVREQHIVGVPSQEHVETQLLDGIRATKGLQIRNSDFMRQDNRLQGWPWIDQTFNWVEPTAWCLLALKNARRVRADARSDARIDQANRLLADRCCAVGGWNYGNSNVFGKDLHSYVPTTAVALLALQDQRDAPEVTRSVKWIRDNGTHEMSGMALSLALLVARVCREPTEVLEEQLCDVAARTGFFGNLATAAMALYALTGSQHEAAALTI